MYNVGVAIPESSSGRTEDSGSSNGGSNPSSGFFVAIMQVIFMFSKIPKSLQTTGIFSCYSKFRGSTFKKVRSSSVLVLKIF